VSKRRSFLSFCLASNSSLPLLLSNHPVNVAKRLQVLAVVLGDGGGNGGGRGGSSGGGGGDAPARAGGGVVLGGSAVLDVGGDDLVVALLEGLDVALELGGLIGINGDGHGGGDSLGGDGGSLEAGAVGLAGSAGEEVTTGTGDGTVAVVSVAAITHLNGTSHGHGGEGQDSEDLHRDCGLFLSLCEKEKSLKLKLEQVDDGKVTGLRGMEREERGEEGAEERDGSIAGCYI
jgi:hypothetical protein